MLLSPLQELLDVALVLLLVLVENTRLFTRRHRESHARRITSKFLELVS